MGRVQTLVRGVESSIFRLSETESSTSIDDFRAEMDLISLDWLQQLGDLGCQSDRTS
mgnify:CR=1 FL=1